MATAREALQIARSLLNDDVALSWPDAVLFPKLQIAHRELQAKLQLHSIPAIKTETSSAITVAAGATDLGVSQPTDLILPIWLKERAVGESTEDLINMVEVQSLPSIAQDSTLRYWVWMSQKLQFVGATVNREVVIQYTKIITVPTIQSSDLGFTNSELYLGARIAYLATKDESYAVQAERALSDIIGIHVKALQGVAHRRRPYRCRPWRRYGAI